MSERDRVDREIAARVQGAAAPPGADPLLRLWEAAGRGQRIRRRRRYAAVATAVLAVAAVPAGAVVAVNAVRGGGSAAVTADTTRLLGTFTTDVPRSGSTTAPVAGRWTLVLHGDGTIGVHAPPGYAGVVTGSAFQTTGGTVRLNLFVQDLCSASPVGRYRWSRDAAGLRFTELTDDCAARRLVLGSGVWRPGT